MIYIYETTNSDELVLKYNPLNGFTHFDTLDYPHSIKTLYKHAEHCLGFEFWMGMRGVFLKENLYRLRQALKQEYKYSNLESYVRAEREDYYYSITTSPTSYYDDGVFLKLNEPRSPAENLKLMQGYALNRDKYPAKDKRLNCSLGDILEVLDAETIPSMPLHYRKIEIISSEDNNNTMESIYYVYRLDDGTFSVTHRVLDNEIIEVFTLRSYFFDTLRELLDHLQLPKDRSMYTAEINQLFSYLRLTTIGSEAKAEVEAEEKPFWNF